jgi:hypothetical protein
VYLTNSCQFQSVKKQEKEIYLFIFSFFLNSSTHVLASIYFLTLLFVFTSRNSLHGTHFMEVMYLGGFEL